MSVLKKLNEARKRFHEAKLTKTGHNTYSNYNYFELADFLVPALKIFDELQLSAVVSFGVDLASMTLTDLEDGSQFVITSPMSTASLKACHEVQNLGAVQTYLRRYLWIAALEIVEHDAVDASEGAAPKASAKPKKDYRNDGTPTTGAADKLTAERRAEVEEIAAYMADCHNNNNELEAIRLWYAADTFQGPEEKIYCWELLKPLSKFRSTIKANKPTTEEAAA